MNNSKTTAPDVVTGDVTIAAKSGLNPFLARQIRDAVQARACTVTIHNGRGMVADARNLLELLLLGAGQGERLTVRCTGPDAHAAHDALCRVFGGAGGQT
jgi:phosphotransferase system HPr (HPr) family protein